MQHDMACIAPSCTSPAALLPIRAWQRQGCCPLCKPPGAAPAGTPGTWGVREADPTCCCCDCWPQIGYWRYISIYRHLQRNPDNQLYPLFEYFENWCQDENRHGDFFSAILKSRPEVRALLMACPGLGIQSSSTRQPLAQANIFQELRLGLLLCMHGVCGIARILLLPAVLAEEHGLRADMAHCQCCALAVAEPCRMPRLHAAVPVGLERQAVEPLLLPERVRDHVPQRPPALRLLRVARPGHHAVQPVRMLPRCCMHACAQAR